MKQKLDRCVNRMMNRSSLQLFGLMLLHFEINLSDEDITAFVKLTKITTDKKKPCITIGKNFADNLTDAELLFVIIHEMMHFIDNDGLATKYKQPQLWNIACDHVINTTICEDINSLNSAGHVIAFPEEGIIIIELKNKKQITKQEVYDYLLKNATFDNGTVKVGGQTIEPDMDVHISEGDPSEIEDGNQLIREILSTVKSLHNANKISSGKGNKTGGISDWLDKLINVKIPWEEVLRNTIISKCVPTNDTRSWGSVNRRYVQYGMMLPGKGSELIRSTLMIVVDTSGSISNDDLSKFTSVISQSISHFDRIQVIDHDTDITNNRIFEMNDDERLNSDDLTLIFSKIEFKGRGGTSHMAAFQYIEDNWKTEDYSLILFLTDGCSDIDRISGQFKWHNDIPYKFLLTEKYKLDFDPNPILIENEK